MTNPDETAALVSNLDAALKRLEVGNGEFPGGCCACLQDVATGWHLPSYSLAKTLDKMGGLRTTPWAAASDGHRAFGFGYGHEELPLPPFELAAFKVCLHLRGQL
jgi:hypothetical protein